MRKEIQTSTWEIRDNHFYLISGEINHEKKLSRGNNQKNTRHFIPCQFGPWIFIVWYFRANTVKLFVYFWWNCWLLGGSYLNFAFVHCITLEILLSVGISSSVFYACFDSISVMLPAGSYLTSVPGIPVLTQCSSQVTINFQFNFNNLNDQWWRTNELRHTVVIFSGQGQMN